MEFCLGCCSQFARIKFRGGGVSREDLQSSLLYLKQNACLLYSKCDKAISPNPLGISNRVRVYERPDPFCKRTCANDDHVNFAEKCSEEDRIAADNGDVFRGSKFSGPRDDRNLDDIVCNYKRTVHEAHESKCTFDQCCKQHECDCQNGVQKTEKYSCREGMTQNCDTCNDGYEIKQKLTAGYITPDQYCDPFKCVCSHGIKCKYISLCWKVVLTY